MIQLHHDNTLLFVQRKMTNRRLKNMAIISSFRFIIINQSIICLFWAVGLQKTTKCSIQCRTGHKGMKHLQVPETKPNKKHKNHQKILIMQRLDGQCSFHHSFLISQIVGNYGRLFYDRYHAINSRICHYPTVIAEEPMKQDNEWNEVMIVLLLPQYDHVTFGSSLSQIRLSSVTFVHPTQRDWNFRQYLFFVLYLTPFVPTYFLIVAKWVYQSVRRHIDLTNLFIFLTSGHCGAQSWAPQCPDVKKLKMVG